MNWKKYIAKEIIYFFSIIILTLIIYSIVEIKNHYLESKSKELNLAQITNDKKIISLNKEILPKDRKKQLIANLTELFEKGASDEDGMKYSRDFKIMFGDKKVFKQIDDISKEKIKIKNEREELRNSFVPNNRKGFTNKAFLLFLILVYPVRFSSVLVLWSIRTLKKNSL